MKRMNQKSTLLLALAVFLLTLASCGTKKAVVADNTTKTTPSKPKTTDTKGAASTTAFLSKVNSNQATAKNIVSDMTFNIKSGSKDISVPGKVSMRKDVVIRLQLLVPLLGTEVGRVEFAPDYVLLVDRMHKEYVKATYSDLDFLKNNGLDFYTLQALFWNELALPGSKKVTNSDLSQFTLGQKSSTSTYPLTLSKGNMAYTWQADAQDGQIKSADIAYKSNSHGNSSLHWNYADFKAVEGKLFPAHQDFTFTTTATKAKKTVSVNIDMDKIKTNSDWETTTTLSKKYKLMDVKSILSKLMNL